MKNKRIIRVNLDPTFIDEIEVKTDWGNVAKTVLKKDKTVNVKTKTGQQYSYKFTTLAEIHKYLEETEQRYYAYIDACESGDGKFAGDYMKFQKLDKDGNKLGDPITGAKVKWSDNVQEYGGNLTSARRYSLLMAYGLACEDDVQPPRPTAALPQHPQTGNSDRLDFEVLKTNLLKFKTLEEVDAAKKRLLDKYPNLTEKQMSAISRIFADREDQLEFPDGVPGWHEAKAGGKS